MCSSDLNVEGERCEATRGDIILTPNGTWHDHGNESKQPVIWIDMLDWPLMEFLDCAWVDQEFKPANTSNTKSQSTLQGSGYSERLYGNGGLVPTFVSHQRGWGNEPTPYIHYLIAETGGLLLPHELQTWRLLHAAPQPYTRERFEDTYNWTVRWNMVVPGATYENTVDNRAWG